eukprot:8279653-Ditylum_brightwellii.AAC.1
MVEASATICSCSGDIVLQVPCCFSISYLVLVLVMRVSTVMLAPSLYASFFLIVYQTKLPSEATRQALNRFVIKSSVDSPLAFSPSWFCFTYCLNHSMLMFTVAMYESNLVRLSLRCDDIALVSMTALVIHSLNSISPTGFPAMWNICTELCALLAWRPWCVVAKVMISALAEKRLLFGIALYQCLIDNQ